VKVVYVAGAFRGQTAWDIQRNVRAAEAAGLEVAELGAMPLIPHKNTENFHGLLTDRFWLEGTLELMRRCDAVYVFSLRDLERSEGTKGEVALARELGIPVFLTTKEISAWLATQQSGTGEGR